MVIDIFFILLILYFGKLSYGNKKEYIFESQTVSKQIIKSVRKLNFYQNSRLIQDVEFELGAFFYFISSCAKLI
jgi:hypothetical protein